MVRMRARKSRSARMVVAALGVLIAALGLGSASALAAAPTITEHVSFSDVGSSSAAVSAQIDPEGEPTTYQFEYTNPETSEAYLSRSPEPATEVDGPGPVSVSGHIEGLRAETLYRVRITATNASGTTQSSPSSFTTLPAGDIGVA